MTLRTDNPFMLAAYGFAATVGLLATGHATVAADGSHGDARVAAAVVRARTGNL